MAEIQLRIIAASIALFLVACGGPNVATPDGSSADLAASATRDAAPVDAAPADAAPAAADLVTSNACAVSGAPGECMTVAACTALTGHTSYAGHCPGPATIECCIKTPSTSDNPPIPAGYKLMMQADVTPAMTTWAVAILNDPVTYPMFATTTKTFGTLNVLARVEWHAPDFQNGVVHRGVTLYEPI